VSLVESTRFTKALGTCSNKVKINHIIFAIKDKKVAIVVNYIYSFTSVTSGRGFCMHKSKELRLCQFRPEPYSYACHLK